MSGLKRFLAMSAVLIAAGGMVSLSYADAAAKGLSRATVQERRAFHCQQRQVYFRKARFAKGKDARAARKYLQIANKHAVACEKYTDLLYNMERADKRRRPGPDRSRNYQSLNTALGLLQLMQQGAAAGGRKHTHGPVKGPGFINKPSRGNVPTVRSPSHGGSVHINRHGMY